MNKGLKKIHKSQFIKFAKGHLGHDFDAESEWDSELNYEENANNLLRKFTLGTIDIEPEMIEAENNQLIENMRAEANKERESLADYFKEVYDSIEKLKMGLKINLVMVKSRAGLGKTTAIKEALEKHELDYVVANNITSTYLYRYFYENNGKVIWMKDCARIFTTKDSLEMLKSACETEPSMRILTKLNYSHDQKDLPEHFVFTGKVIFDYNSMVNLKYSEDFEALVSRGDYIELTFSRKEMKDIMKKIAGKEQWKQQVTDYLVSNYDFTNRFNLRHQQKAFVDYSYAKKKRLEWKAYIKSQIDKNRSPVGTLVYQFIGDDIVKKSYLAKCLLKNNIVNTKRTAYRRIGEWLDMEELYELQGQVSLKPIVNNGGME